MPSLNCSNQQTKTIHLLSKKTKSPYPYIYEAGVRSFGIFPQQNELKWLTDYQKHLTNNFLSISKIRYSTYCCISTFRKKWNSSLDPLLCNQTTRPTQWPPHALILLSFLVCSSWTAAFLTFHFPSYHRGDCRDNRWGGWLHQGGWIAHPCRPGLST